MTAEQVHAKRAEFEAALEGYRRPAAHGIVHETDGRLEVVKVNLEGQGPLPAAVLATVTGYRSGSAALPLSAAELDRAIELAAPAEACTALPHPNLWAWRLLRETQGTGGRAVAVFTDRIDDPAPVDPYVRAFLNEVHRGRQEDPDGGTTLWRPVGPAELELLRASGMREWPPRLPDQPIFYPVLREEYAAEIARDWNVDAAGSGHVTRFRVATAFARRYPTRQAGGSAHLELWIPAEDVPALNAHLLAPIEITASFGP
ncbi:hypothetical protein GCM10022221_32600 [Actinocorallia aurea]